MNTKLKPKEAATILGISERKLRTSRSTGILCEVPTPTYYKQGSYVYYHEQDLNDWLETLEQNQSKNNFNTIYIVWSEENVEGFVTTDKALAVSVQNGDWDACGDNHYAKAFCDIHSESSISNIQIKQI